jgi:hypothetical protein
MRCGRENSTFDRCQSSIPKPESAVKTMLNAGQHTKKIIWWYPETMKSPLHLALVPAVTLLVAVLSSFLAPSLRGQDIEQQDRYERLQQRLLQLEGSQGYNDPVLIEVLVSLADSAAAQNRRAESSTLLSRAIQIQRRAFGLFNADQVPLYFNLIMYDLALQDWDSVNHSLNHLDWLLTQKKAVSESTVVDYLIHLSEYHLLGVAGDATERQAGHFRQAEELTSLALELSEDMWGRQDSRRIDLYYSMLKQLYLQSAALELGNDTMYALRQIIPDVNIVRPKQVVQKRYYQQGLGLFREMREVLVESDEKPAESLAMLELYAADWHLLFNNDRARVSYEYAFEALLQAGVDEDQLNRLFSLPQILPVPQFFRSVARAAVEWRTDSPAQSTTNAGVEDPLVFKDWFRSMPFVPFPVASPALEQSLTSDYTDTLLNIRLNSLQSVSRWVKGTYRTHSGIVEEYTLAGEGTGQTVDLDYLNQRLHFLHFRPPMKNGNVRPFEGRLLYSMAIE